jgi:hypothetical protein
VPAEPDGGRNKPDHNSSLDERDVIVAATFPTATGPPPDGLLLC